MANVLAEFLTGRPVRGVSTTHAIYITSTNFGRLATGMTLEAVKAYLFSWSELLYKNKQMSHSATYIPLTAFDRPKMIQLAHAFITNLVCHPKLKNRGLQCVTFDDDISTYIGDRAYNSTDFKRKLMGRGVRNEFESLILLPLLEHLDVRYNNVTITMTQSGTFSFVDQHGKAWSKDEL